METQNPYTYKPVDETAPPALDAPEMATRNRRFWAVMIDGVISAAITLPIAYAFTGSFFARSAGSADRGFLGNLLNASSPLVMASSAVATVVYLAVQAWSIHRRGQTLGKMALGITIAKRGGFEKAGFVQIGLVRIFLVELIGLVPLAGPLFGFVDSLFIFRKDRRCLHDFIARTWVVKLPRP